MSDQPRKSESLEDGRQAADAGGRQGGWTMLSSGRRFWPFDPRPEDVDIGDIAHALSHVCRYGGHTRRFYSVAEHSINVAMALPPELRLAGLLHDAAEAYLGDIPRPIKRGKALRRWREAEERLERVIAERFWLNWPMPAGVKAVDDRIILDEWAALMPATALDIGVSGKPLGIRIPSANAAGDPEYQRARFLSLFEELTRSAERHDSGELPRKVERR